MLPRIDIRGTIMTDEGWRSPESYTTPHSQQYNQLAKIPKAQLIATNIYLGCNSTHWTGGVLLNSANFDTTSSLSIRKKFGIGKNFKLRFTNQNSNSYFVQPYLENDTQVCKLSPKIKLSKKGTRPLISGNLVMFGGISLDDADVKIYRNTQTNKNYVGNTVIDKDRIFLKITAAGASGNGGYGFFGGGIVVAHWLEIGAGGGSGASAILYIDFLQLAAKSNEITLAFEANNFLIRITATAGGELTLENADPPCNSYYRTWTRYFSYTYTLADMTVNSQSGTNGGKAKLRSAFPADKGISIVDYRNGCKGGTAYKDSQIKSVFSEGQHGLITNIYNSRSQAGAPSIFTNGGAAIHNCNQAGKSGSRGSGGSGGTEHDYHGGDLLYIFYTNAGGSGGNAYMEVVY